MFSIGIRGLPALISKSHLPPLPLLKITATFSFLSFSIFFSLSCLFIFPSSYPCHLRQAIIYFLISLFNWIRFSLHLYGLCHLPISLFNSSSFFSSLYVTQTTFPSLLVFLHLLSPILILPINADLIWMLLNRIQSKYSPIGSESTYLYSFLYFSFIPAKVPNNFWICGDKW